MEPDALFGPARSLSQATRATRPGASSAAETTFVGFNPAYASPSSPWSIGVGVYRPFAGAGTTAWDWDTPSRGPAVVSFGLPGADRVTLRLYDVSGRLVRTLLDRQSFRAGEWEVAWDGRDDAGREVPRGVYFASFGSEAGRSYQKKVTVLR